MNPHRARRIVYERSQHSCERCGDFRASEWHHRRNRSQAGQWQPANGLHLCSPCHQWITAHPAESYEQGWLVPSWAEPEETSVLHRGRLVYLDDHGNITPEQAIGGAGA